MENEMRKHIDSFRKFSLNENFTKGNLVQLKYDIERNEDDGEYGYSIDAGEIGEIRYIVPSTENESDENKVYMVKFSDDKNKQGQLSKGRYIQLTKGSFDKVVGLKILCITF